MNRQSLTSPSFSWIHHIRSIFLNNRWKGEWKTWVIFCLCPMCLRARGARLAGGVSSVKMLIGSQAIPWAIRQHQHSLTTVNPYFTIIWHIFQKKATSRADSFEFNKSMRNCREQFSMKLLRTLCREQRLGRGFCVNVEDNFIKWSRQNECGVGKRL